MTCTVFLAGSGGGFPDITQLRTGPDHNVSFETIDYPGWKRYVQPNFTPELLISDLSAEIEARVPMGPIRIVGISMGGHFGYLVALDLQARGRQVESLCAIDSFVVNTAAPTPGWRNRALAEFVDISRRRKFDEMYTFCRSKVWRAVLRAAGDMLPALLRKASDLKWAVHALEVDPILKRELDIRMMSRTCADWLAQIDEAPCRLSIRTALLRTPDHADSDAMWRNRCSNLSIYEIRGSHETLFEPENIGCLRDAFAKAFA